MMPPPGYILIRPETLVGVQKAVEAALGARAAECLAAGGRAGGVKATAQLEGDAASRAARLLEAGRGIGWGGFAPRGPANPGARGRRAGPPVRAGVRGPRAPRGPPHAR